MLLLSILNYYKEADSHSDIDSADTIKIIRVDSRFQSINLLALGTISSSSEVNQEEYVP